jgi:hypothetical protein
VAFTYKWSDVVNMAKPFVKNIPLATGNTDIMACDFVSSRIASAVPWAPLTQTMAPVSLVDGTQDYDVPINVFRLLQVRLTNTGVTPNQSIELNIQHSLAPDLTPRSWQAIRAVSLEPGVGQLRLESAVQVPSGATYQIDGEYQINQTKITALSQDLWFSDSYVHVAMSGLLYYFYKMAGMAEAGILQADQTSGRSSGTGQLGEFIAGIWEMRRVEMGDYGEQMHPSESLGSGQDVYPFGV